MKVLVIGGGGREHALAWKLATSPRVSEVLVTPGNAGTAGEPGVRNIAISADDLDALLALAQAESIALTVVGPENPLVAGIVDRFSEAGLACFGPSAAAAQLEGSKAFAKEFLTRHNIPTADSATFTDSRAALDYLRERQLPIVIKADGLAAGKGVVVAQSRQDAETAMRSMLDEAEFGDAGRRILIEDFLVGEEASFIAMVDGEHILPLATSQDHKARDAGDTGPNTGGMGAYSPAPVVTPAIEQHIMETIMQPAVAGMAADGHPYTGFLYAGLMIDDAGQARVLEFNCRFGDPETQPVLFRLRSDLVDLIEAALAGELDEQNPSWDERVAVGVVLAAGGYPGSYRRGDVIQGLPSVKSADSKVFHAGTARYGDQIVTNGGRVLCAVALGETTAMAQSKAYELARSIYWKDIQFRPDIGHRAVARESA